MKMLKKNQIPVLVVSLLVLIPMWGMKLLASSSVLIDGKRFWFLADDAMISMRYARNMAEGLGLVMNQGEYVEGYSNFLWTMVMSGFHLLPVRTEWISILVIFFNVILAICTIVLLLRISDEFKVPNVVSLFIVVAIVLNLDYFHWVASGLEATALGFLFTLVFFLILSEMGRSVLSFRTHFLLGVLAIVRADALVLSILLAVFAMMMFHSIRAVLKYSWAAMLLPLAHMVFRVMYYGDLLPNTAYLKTQYWEGKLDYGVRYVTSFVIDYFLIIIVVLLAVILRRGRYSSRILAILMSIYIGYVAYVGGDVFIGNRFLMPVLPLLIFLSFVALWGFVDHFSSVPSKKSPSAIILVTVASGIALVAIAIAPEFMAIGSEVEFGSFQRVILVCGAVVVLFAIMWLGLQKMESANRILVNIVFAAQATVLFCSMPLIEQWSAVQPDESSEGNIKIGLWLHDNTPDSARVADFYAGSVFYFSRRYAIDLLGKCDSTIARMRAVDNGPPGHNKYDFNYSLGTLRPDYVVSMLKHPVPDSVLKISSTRGFSFARELYRNSYFNKCYKENIAWDGGWRTIYYKTVLGGN